MASDHFSTQSADYARYRPDYPEELFAWIGSLVSERRVAWDCACGSGQATVALARWFDHVDATDLSTPQLSHAPSLEKVSWRVATAEESGFAPRSVDLITVAQALHWFDLPRFWRECQRVLKLRGVVVVWSYGVFELDDPGASTICTEYYRDTLDPYWPPERRIVEKGYSSLEFPFEEIAAPSFELRKSWTIRELTGYLASWSATERYRRETGHDPIPELRGRLEEATTRSTLDVRWPLSLRAGRFAG